MQIGSGASWNDPRRTAWRRGGVAVRHDRGPVAAVEVCRGGALGHQRQQRLASQCDNTWLVTVEDHVDDQAVDALVKHVPLQALGHTVREYR